MTARFAAEVYMVCRAACWCVLALMWVLPTAPAAEDRMVPNADFTEGQELPAGWKLSGGQGRWVDREVLEVTGTGKGSNAWQCQCNFSAGGYYRFAMKARATGGTGAVISGPEFANHDWRLAPEWKWYDFVFRVPDHISAGAVRLGQWEANGTFQFDAVTICPVLPVHKQCDDALVLGEGELLSAQHYTFSAILGHAVGVAHRPLHWATATVNTDRWVFYRDAEVVYRFQLPGIKLGAGAAEVNINYVAGGACQLQYSPDGQQWHTLGQSDRVGAISAQVPPQPDGVVWLRICSATGRGVFQVNRILFSAEIATGAGGRQPPQCIGKTWFVELPATASQLVLERAVVRPAADSGNQTLRLWVRNNAVGAGKLTLSGELVEPDQTRHPLPTTHVTASEKQSAMLSVDLPVVKPGRSQAVLKLKSDDPAAHTEPVELRIALDLPEYHRADYGYLLPGDDKADLWWCEATHKVWPQRALPTERSNAAQLWAAKNDWEALQVVIRPKQQLVGLGAVATPLVGPGGATIPQANVRVLRVAYHFVHTPTDATGVIDWWPDALPPLPGSSQVAAAGSDAQPVAALKASTIPTAVAGAATAGGAQSAGGSAGADPAPAASTAQPKQKLDLPPGRNQPLWVLVYVPKDARAGTYSGKVTITADGYRADVPLRLHVWDFALPEKNNIETAFGLSPHLIYRYHQLKGEQERRRVLDMYLQSFAEHRISPYNPVPLDPIVVRFLPDADPPRAEMDFSRFEAAMSQALEKYRFTNFMLPLQGMGGGTFHERHEPMIGKYGEDTPQYQAVFASYVKQLEEHLKARGWLKMAYVYWFDEPEPKDYQFVRKGMERIKRYAPGIQTMLTEEPNDALAGPIDIWCPVSFNYDHQKAEQRRAKGERIWWYICCGPKAPYCTLFIDHPATELRVWLWQTWQRNISGILIWSANYWTSDTAFPDTPQDPYEDPMGYVSGYGTPKGVKQYWGNGDGRFIYPPEEAATPGRFGPQPVIAPPVSSIRWEMLREGIEDYEFLWLLRDLLRQKRDKLSAEQLQQYEALLTVPESITRDMTSFTKHPGPIYSRRAEIARAIEQLQQM